MSLLALGYSIRFLRSLIVISPSKWPFASIIGSFSTLLFLKIFSASSSVQPFGAVISGALVIFSPTSVAVSVSKRRSRLVKIPISTPLSSITGIPLMWYSLIRSRASLIVASALIEIGSIMTPLSLFFTRRTILAWESSSIFLWITPMPPRRAIIIAVRYSVTVSIAALTRGVFSVIFFVKLVLISTSLGKISEYCGTNKTSSKVRAFLTIFILILSRFFLNSSRRPAPFVHRRRAR